ncbi:MULTISPECIES: hypothetical protein [Nocardia]|uniref:hypothetical protein n=1 Tax=Nocardia TaxID=1817 RepID=UPI002457E8D1|nr:MULTISPECIES: hypothetical protein [Nocardia]
MPEHPPMARRLAPGALPPHAIITDSDSQGTVARDEMCHAVPASAERHRPDPRPTVGMPVADRARKVVTQRAADLPATGRDRHSAFPCPRSAKGNPA